MKIVYISNSIIPSRTANSIHVMKMCQAFADNGHKVVLLAPNRKKEYEKGVEDIYEFYGVKKNFEVKKISYINIRFVRNIFYALKTQLLLKRIKPDLVYGRDLLGCFFSSFWYKTVFEAHAPMQRYLSKKLLDIMNKSSYYKHTVVISQALKNIILKTQNIKPDKLIVAHDGADEVLDFDKKVELLGNKDSLKVGYVGHLYKGRGIELIIECAKELKDVTFHLVGGTLKDFEYWNEIIKKQKQNNIFLYGFKTPKEVVKFRNSFDIFLAPYLKKVETAKGGNDTSKFMSPLKIFEYMAHKKAIISSDLPVLREVLNETNSILVNPENSIEWIEAIKKLKDENLREKLSNQALSDFEKYTWKNRVKEVLC